MKNKHITYALCSLVLLFLCSCTHQENEGFGNKKVYYGQTKGSWTRKYTDSAGVHTQLWDTTYTDAIWYMRDPGIQSSIFETSQYVHPCTAPDFLFNFTTNDSNVYLKKYDSISEQRFHIKNDSLVSQYTQSIILPNDTTWIMLSFHGKN